MKSIEARDYIRIATIETVGLTKRAAKQLMADSEKLDRIRLIVQDELSELTQDEMSNAEFLIRKIVEESKDDEDEI